LERVSAVGQGLMSLEGFSAKEPLDLVVQNTLVKADALLMWRSPDADFTKALDWTGSGNRYDIGGSAWVVRPPEGPDSFADALPGSPTDLDSWVEAIPGDSNARAQSVRFPKTSRAGAHQPKDFVPEDGNGPPKAGADPAHVGPKPASKS